MAATNRQASFMATMVWEGRDRLSLDPHDPGNYTGGKVGIGKLMGSRFGVSAMVAARMGKTPASLTVDDALKVFIESYWNPVAADMMAAGVDHCVSDDAYNAGAGSALGRWRRGGWTKASDPVATIHAYSARRLSFLEALRTWRLFSRGWAARVAGVEAESIKMARTAGTILPLGLMLVGDHLDDQSNLADKKATSARWRGSIGVIVAIAALMVAEHFGPGSMAVMLLGAAVALHQFWEAHVQAIRRDVLGEAA